MRMRKDAIARIAASALQMGWEMNDWLCPFCARSSSFDLIREYHESTLQLLTTWFRCRSCDHVFNVRERIINGQLINVEGVKRADA